MAIYYRTKDGKLKKREEKTKGQKKNNSKKTLFQKGSFDDGYQFGDVTKAILGTTADAGVGILKGAGRLVEGIVDLGGYGVAEVAELFGADKFADNTRKAMQVDAVGEMTKGIDKELNKHSLLGYYGDAVAEGVGQIGTIILTGGAAAGSLGALGATALTSGLMGASSMGSGIGEAYQGGATDGQAWGYGAMKGAVDMASEWIFGGLGKGVKALGLGKGLTSIDDVFARKVSGLVTKHLGNKTAQKVLGNTVEYAIKSGAEGLEEVLAGIGTAYAKKFSYMSDKDIDELKKDENLLEQFIVGSLTSAIAQGGDMFRTTSKGQDFITGHTSSEQKVIDNEVNRIIEERKKNGEKVKKSEIYEDVENSLKKGYIGTDTIESIIGDKAYSEYKKASDTERAEAERLNKEISSLEDKINSSEDISSEDREKLSSLRGELESLTNNSKVNELKEKLDAFVRDKVKGTSLAESYNEIERQTEKFKADLSKYTAKEQRIVQKAIDSSILNNTNRSHELVDLIAKLSAHLDVDFDFVNNERLKASGFAIEGKTVNGYVTKDGITINTQSPKYLNSVIGHEITHVLKGSELFDSLKTNLFAYAESKGELETRRKTLEKLYEDKDADIDEELTADLVGDYIFTDRKFVEHLLNTDRNAFQKIYDELKYLCKIATTGSKEEKALLKAKKIFDDVYSKGETNSVEGVKYSVERIGDINYVKAEKNIFVKKDGTLASEKEVFNSLVGKTISLPDGDVKIVKRLPQKDMYNELSRRYPKQLGNIENVRQLNSDVNYNMEELLENSELKTPNETDKGGKHQAQGINSFDTRTVNFYDGNKAYNIEFSIAVLQNGEKIAYAKKYFGYNKKLTKKIQSAEVRSNQSPLNQRSAKEGLTPSNTIIRNSAEKSTGKFSLSAIAPETSPNGTLKITSDDVYSKGETNSVEGVKYAVSNWSEQKNQTQAEITINYQRTVDNVLRGNYNGDSSVIMGYTPSIYQEMGMPSLPFVIGTGHIYSTAKTKSEAIQENKYNKKNNYHGLGKQTVKNLYEAVKDPVMIISSKDVKLNAKPLRSTHSIVSIVDVGTNGKHLLLPIEITATRTVNGNKMDVNVLSSAYEKNVSELIKEAVALENTGDVGFYYIKNGDTTIVDSGVQFPVHLNDRISPNGIIRSFSEKVNMNLSDVTQSQQFKRWFGDWQNRPQKASKVVNEDGTPLIMYHGTNSDAFTVFDSTKSDKKAKLNTLGDGYYFTKSKERASRYGENIMETYLDIKKPYRVYPRDGGIKAQIEEDFGISADSLHRNDIQSVLKSKGYDGILLHYSKYHDTDWETAVVFEPTQIKSATDNVGTYDKNNPNINYSLSPIAPEIAPNGTLKITSDDVTLKANPKSNESVKDTEDITFEEASPFADEPTLTELKAERDGKFSNAEKSYVSMEDFANSESPLWRNVDYNDDDTKSTIMQQTHNSMVEEGKVVTVSDDVRANVTESFPDLRGMKKKERTAILREAMTNLKNNLRQFLGGLKNQTFEFEIDGKVLEAKLYSTGINEVLEKVTENKANMLYTTEEIFKNAQYLYSTTDYDSDPNVYRWNYFYTPVQIGNEIVGVRIAVRDLAKQGESQIYNWGIKKDATLGGVRDDFENRKSYGTSSDASSETSLGDVQPVNFDSSHGTSSDVSDNIIPTSSQNVNTPKRPTREELHNNIDKLQDTDYNIERGEQYARTDEFRKLQAESQRMSVEDTQLYWTGSKQLDDGLRERLSRSVKHIFLESFGNGRGNDSRLLKLSAKGKQYSLYENVNGSLFHDVFEIARKHLRNGELVDLHKVETTDNGIGYNDCYNYLSEDGLSGFSITPDGDLISVFNASGKGGFLRAIAPIVREKAKTLDCFASSKQNLQIMYEDIFGFKTASVMDYNMEYDHDSIAQNHNMPKVAFMVNTENDVHTKYFGKEEYTQAIEYRNSFTNETTKAYSIDIAPPIKQTSSDDGVFFDGASKAKERSFVKISTESDVVGGQIVTEDLSEEARTYVPVSNEKTLDTARKNLTKDGYEKAVNKAVSLIESKGEVSLIDIAECELLISEALKRGDTKTAGEIIENVAIIGTELGQKVQALSLINRMTPEGQLRTLEKIVNRNKQSISGKSKEDVPYMRDKAFAGVEITQEMKDRILSAYNEDGSWNQEELDKAVEDVKQMIAEQMTVSFREKANAWRYLSMLGNPKTHIRNMLSNVAMTLTLKGKNAIARTAETLFSDSLETRTKTWKKATNAVTNFSKEVTEEMEGVFSGESKYSDVTDIKRRRRMFESEILQKIYGFISRLFSKEDVAFKRYNFRKAFSEFLTANGIRSVEDIEANAELIEKGKVYALEQAEIATFQQHSVLASEINRWANKHDFLGVGLDAVIPFKKTPINIAKTGLSYSPLGFAKTLTSDLQKLRHGKIDATTLIDNISQNITGTGLMLLGFYLASQGILNGAGEDDEESQFDYQLGEQRYSITIGDSTYTIDWLSPVAMPLFVGTNAYETFIKKEEWSPNVVIEALAKTADPLSEMSVLSSLDNVLSSYSGGTQRIGEVGKEMVQSYVGQYIPTILSQTAATFDDTKRTTKASADSKFTWGEEIIRSMMYKIPGLRNLLEPSIDIWGNRIKQNDNIVLRAVENFVSPALRKGQNKSEVNEELKDIYREVGENSIFPNVPKSSVTYNKEKYPMSAKEYTAFREKYGQTAYNTLQGLFETETYQNASDDEKADLIEKAYTYARDEAKKEHLDLKGVEYTNSSKDKFPYYKENSIKGAVENDVSPEEYEFSVNKPDDYALVSNIFGYDKYQDYKKALSEIKGENAKRDKAKYIQSLSLKAIQKKILFKSLYPSDHSYDYDIIQYINSLKITKSEKEKIARALGFEVKE